MPFSAWRRVPEFGACPWCLMLATRGAVYRSKATAKTARGKSSYHRHCKCRAELESRFDQRTDIRADPGDADRIITNRVKDRQDRYDLSRYRNLGITNPPPLPEWVTPRLTPVARMQDAAGRSRADGFEGSPPPQGPKKLPSAADLFAEGVVGEGDEYFLDQEQPMADWLRERYGWEVRSVASRHEKWPTGGYSTPDAVARGGNLGLEWVALEIKRAKAAANILLRARKAKNEQAAHIVFSVRADEVSRRDVDAAVAELRRKYMDPSSPAIKLLIVRAVTDSGETAWSLVQWAE